MARHSGTLGTPGTPGTPGVAATDMNPTTTAVPAVLTTAASGTAASGTTAAATTTTTTTALIAWRAPLPLRPPTPTRRLCGGTLPAPDPVLYRRRATAAQLGARGRCSGTGSGRATSPAGWRWRGAKRRRGGRNAVTRTAAVVVAAVAAVAPRW